MGLQGRERESQPPDAPKLIPKPSALEVQAAVGSVLFRFKAEFAGLPRILAHGFKHIPDATRMLEEFPKWPDQDHNPAFKACGGGGGRQIGRVLHLTQRSSTLQSK